MVKVTELKKIEGASIRTGYPKLMRVRGAIVLILSVNEDEDTLEGVVLNNSHDHKFGEYSKEWANSMYITDYHGIIKLKNIGEK